MGDIKCASSSPTYDAEPEPPEPITYDSEPEPDHKDAGCAYACKKLAPMCYGSRRHLLFAPKPEVDPMKETVCEMVAMCGCM